MLTALSSKTRPQASTTVMQAKRLQRLAYESAESIAADLKTAKDEQSRGRAAISLARLIDGWNTAADRRRIASGKALPGHLSPAERKPRRAGAKASAPQPIAPLTSDASRADESKPLRVNALGPLE